MEKTGYIRREIPQITGVLHHFRPLCKLCNANQRNILCRLFGAFPVRFRSVIQGVSAVRRCLLVTLASVAAGCIVACGGGGSGAGGGGVGGGDSGGAFVVNQSTKKVSPGRAPGAKLGVPQLDDPDRPNHDPDDMDADPNGKFLDINPFTAGEVVTLRAQRYDPFVVLARNGDRDLSKWETPRNQVNPGQALADFEKKAGIIRLAPGTKVTVNNSTALYANVTVAADQPDHGRSGFVLPGTVGRAAKLLAWRQANGK